MSSVSYFCILNFSGMSSYLPISADSPEVSLHQQYEHSAADKGITIKIDCVAHGNPSPQVCDTLAELETIEKEFRSIKVFWTFQCYTVNLIQFHNKKVWTHKNIKYIFLKINKNKLKVRVWIYGREIKMSKWKWLPGILDLCPATHGSQFNWFTISPWDNSKFTTVAWHFNFLNKILIFKLFWIFKNINLVLKALASLLHPPILSRANFNANGLIWNKNN